ncbi:hypothetical protein GRI58_13150 [Porphyrobacter algicida]|uniref:DUF1801 domain-containing protein n=1 Tax=Qipengyuania algicida TaxID=1836209 RepID=A0A845ALL0_9SPHN|nr:hypothetical protein [Qipengyuania algicida]MXP29755.1 hypothetical protein [Qipengyuania algicida]
MGDANDWRTATLEQACRMIAEAAPNAAEERKWKKPTNLAGVPTWSAGGIICTGETYKDILTPSSQAPAPRNLPPL